jgi:hypothetical protein
VAGFFARLADKGVCAIPLGTGKIRVVTHLHINDDEIERASTNMLD